ncbi:MAG TPA: hypothetical protein VGJ20_12825 [Xanthobacteraceae bacterium]
MPAPDPVCANSDELAPQLVRCSNLTRGIVLTGLDQLSFKLTLFAAVVVAVFPRESNWQPAL